MQFQEVGSVGINGIDLAHVKDRRRVWLTDIELASMPYTPFVPRPYLKVPLFPISVFVIPVSLLKFRMTPRIIFLMNSGYKKKESRYTCLSETKALHSQ